MDARRTATFVALAAIGALAARWILVNVALEYLGYQERQVLAALPAVRIATGLLLAGLLIWGQRALAGGQRAFLTVAWTLDILGGLSGIAPSLAGWANLAHWILSLAALGCALSSILLVVQQRREESHAA